MKESISNEEIARGINQKVIRESPNDPDLDQEVELIDDDEVNFVREEIAVGGAYEVPKSLEVNGKTIQTPQIRIM